MKFVTDIFTMLSVLFKNKDALPFVQIQFYRRLLLLNNYIKVLCIIKNKIFSSMRSTSICFVVILKLAQVKSMKRYSPEKVYSPLRERVTGNLLQQCYQIQTVGRRWWVLQRFRRKLTKVYEVLHLHRIIKIKKHL